MQAKFKLTRSKLEFVRRIRFLNSSDRDEIEFTGHFIDSRNIDGEETGSNKQWKMEFFITLFPIVWGYGKDDVGEFRWRAHNNRPIQNTERIRFIKEYDTHEVYYFGSLRGGLISGRWSLGDEGPSGHFAIWPKNYMTLLEQRIETKDERIKERNMFERKLIFVEIDNSIEDVENFYFENKSIVQRPKPLNNFVFRRKQNLSHIKVDCHFNQTYQGPLEILPHFDYLHYSFFKEESTNCVNIDTIEADYLSFIVDLKQQKVSLSILNEHQLLELFATAVFLVEIKLMDRIVAEICQRYVCQH